MLVVVIFCLKKVKNSIYGRSAFWQLPEDIRDEVVYGTYDNGKQSYCIERIAVELDVATQIQSAMLPCIFPAFPQHKEFDIYATMQPAKEVGGDFYDFFPY
jgi:hypothetical protein